MEKDRPAVPFSLVSLFELNLMSKQTPMPAQHFARERFQRVRYGLGGLTLGACAYICILYASIVTDRKLHNQPQTNAFCPATFVLFLASDMNPATRELDNGSHCRLDSGQPAKLLWGEIAWDPSQAGVQTLTAGLPFRLVCMHPSWPGVKSP